MNIEQIVKDTAERIEPTLTKMIDNHAASNHPEIVNGRKVLIEKRTKLTANIRDAIKLAVDLASQGKLGE